MAMAMAEPQAPKMPGMPPSPSGGGGESSTAPPAGAADAAAPETYDGNRRLQQLLGIEMLGI